MPGVHSTHGRFDQVRNGLWLAHGWMGDDAWFAENQRAKADYDTDSARLRLRSTCTDNGIRYLFPHLCPASSTGKLALHDCERVETLLDALPDVKILPWVGGVHRDHCPVESSRWRALFVDDCAALLSEHPRFAGIHLNIEPMPDGNPAFLLLLDELKSAIGSDKILSVAAYPPPTRWHPYPAVHWSEAYYREIDRRCDQLVPMMYDTGLRSGKIYTWLVESWTRELLEWTDHSELLLGLPAYEDLGVAYHDPKVENLENAIGGVNAGLLSSDSRLGKLEGIALYADWTISAQEWRTFRDRFAKSTTQPDNPAPAPAHKR